LLSIDLLGPSCITARGALIRSSVQDLDRKVSQVYAAPV